MILKELQIRTLFEQKSVFFCPVGFCIIVTQPEREREEKET